MVYVCFICVRSARLDSLGGPGFKHPVSEQLRKLCESKSVFQIGLKRGADTIGKNLGVLCRVRVKISWGSMQMCAVRLRFAMINVDEI